MSPYEWLDHYLRSLPLEELQAEASTLGARLTDAEILFLYGDDMKTNPYPHQTRRSER